MYRVTPLRWGCLLAMLLLVSSLQTAQAQLVSVTVTGVDTLLETAKYGLGMAGKKDLADQLDGLINAFLQGDGFKGLDTKKSMGLYLNKFPTNPAAPPVVIYLPITNEADFLELLGKANITLSKEEKGVRSFGLPTGQQAYLKIKGNYAYVCLDEDELSSLADPVKLAAKFPANALLHVQVGINEIPQELKEKFLAKVDEGIKAEKAKKPSENDTEFQLRMMGMNFPRQALEHLVMDSEKMSVTFLLDKTQHVFSIDTTLSAKTGSRLQQEMQALGSSKSKFTSLLESAPASMVYHGAMTDLVRQDFDKLLDSVVKKAIADEKSLMKKAVAEKIYSVLEPTLKAKTYELALSVRNTGESQPMTGLGALRVTNGKQIEEMVKGLIVEMKEPERKNIQVDAEKVGDVNIHVINIPDHDKASKEIIEAFGAARISVAFHNDAIVVGLGKNSIEEVKRVVTSINQGSSINPPPMQVLVHAKPFARFVKEAAVRKAFETVFTTPESDEVKFTVTGGDQMRWKFEVSTQFLKLIEAAEKAKAE